MPTTNLPITGFARLETGTDAYALVDELPIQDVTVNIEEGEHERTAIVSFTGPQGRLAIHGPMFGVHQLLVAADTELARKR